MIEDAKSQTQQLKKFNFFVVETVSEQVPDPKTHPIRLTDINVTDIGQVRSKILLLDESSNSVLVFGKCVQASWTPHSEATFRMITTTTNYNEVVLTYGEDGENQMRSIYIKLWTIPEGTDFTTLKPRKLILIGKLGEPERILTKIHLVNDMSILAAGSKRGTVLLFESRNLLENEYKSSIKTFEKKEIRAVQAVRRGNECDIYFANEEGFYWLENLNEKRRILQAQVDVLEATKAGHILVSFKHDSKFIFEYKAGKQIRSYPLEGTKKIIKEFRSSYLIILTFERRNQKLQKSADKYYVHILDTVNQYIAYFETFSKVESVLANDLAVTLVVGNQKGERLILNLTEKDNSFKIETFFKRSFYSEALRFAKNQNCQESLLARISQLHGDMLYSKNDFAGAIKQYIATLGFLQPSYVIRKFLQVTQIDFLIQYLQKIHERKLAKKEHTALLLNCYVKKQKIEHLSTFLSQSSLESDLFDIETAIKVCKDLTHYQEALKLAEQKNKHELYLKILIENKRDYEKALEYIRVRVPLEEKEKFLIQFGQEFMKFLPKKAIQLIKLLIRAHSISQLVRGKERDYVLTADEKQVFQTLHFPPEDLESLTVITFKKPDEFFRLFLVNNEDLEQFLLYLIRDVPKLPHEQIVFHRLIEFYLEMMKESPSRKEDFTNRILDNLQNNSRKPDHYILLSLFKMYQFDEGVVSLCKKLGIRDDLLNFYISKSRDKDILELCREHGQDQVNLWVHALKYFVKSEYRKEHNIPDILTELAKIPNLSPLPILAVLSKNKNVEYHYIKRFFLSKLKEDRVSIDRDQEVVRKNMRKAEESRAQFKKLKTTAKSFPSNICTHCQNGLTVPAIYFMCGHSFHENCLGGERECSKCRFDMRNIIERKDRYAEGAQDQAKLFQILQERKQSAFEVVSEYLGRGLFVNPSA